MMRRRTMLHEHWIDRWAGCIGRVAGGVTERADLIEHVRVREYEGGLLQAQVVSRRVQVGTRIVRWTVLEPRSTRLSREEIRLVCTGEIVAQLRRGAALEGRTER